MEPQRHSSLPYRFVDQGEEAFVGEVRVAEQLGVEGFVKQVRIWSIRSELCAEADAVALLLEDLKRAAELSAFSISQLLNVWGESSSDIVLATEHLSGLTLHEFNGKRTGGEPLPLPADIAVALEVARALEHAHDPHVAGGVVVHGDIRPEYVLMGHEGAVKLTGFGFDRFLPAVSPDGAWLSWQGRRYQPPERDDGGGDAIDPRSDIYAVGLLLLESVCSAAGRDDDPTSLLAPLRAGELTGSMDVPEDVAEVVLRACAAQVEDRYATAGDLAADLHRLLLERRTVSTSGEIVRTALGAFSPLASPTRETTLPTAPTNRTGKFVAPTLKMSMADVLFVGRTEILRNVAKALAGTIQGTGRALLLRGESGMGRSRVLTEIGLRLSSSPRRVAWLHVAGRPAEQAVQYAAVLRLLGAAVGLGPEDDLSHLADAADRFRALGLEAGELEAIRAVLGVEDPPDPARLAGLLSSAVIRCVASLCWEQTTVVAWDDLQWADDASLGCLYELLCRVSTMPVIVALTAPPRFELPWSLPPGSTDVSLGPLSRSACKELLLLKRPAARWVEADLLDRLMEHSGGNPLLFEELVDLLGEEGRLAVVDRGVTDAAGAGEPLPRPEEVIRERVAALDDESRAVALAAAVAGPALSRDLIATATGIRSAAVRRCLDELAGQIRILKWSPAGYAFRHGRTRQAVLASASPEMLRALRTHVAQAILDGVDLTVRGLDDHAARLLTENGEEARAADVLLDAARRQEARGDLRGAAERYSKAIYLAREAGSLGPGVELGLCMAAGRAAIYSLNLDLGEEALLDATELADRDGDARQGAEARVLLCRLLARQGRLEEAMDCAQEAMPLAESSGDSIAIAKVCGAIAESCQQWGQLGPDIDYIDRALALASDAGDLQLVGEYLQLAVTHAVGVGEYDRMGELLERARAIGSVSDDALLTCQLHKAEALSLCFSGEPEAALKVNLEGIALAHARGFAEAEIIMLHNCGDDYLAMGQEREALYYYSESLRRSQAARFDRLTEANQMYVGYLEATYLQCEEGLERIHKAIESSNRVGRIWNENQGYRLLGRALLVRGDRAGAVGYLEEAVRLAKETGVQHFLDEAEQWLARARDGDESGG